VADDVLITPASRKIEFKDTAGNVDAVIQTDASGNLAITNTGGDVSIGDTTSDVYIGDGTNNVDIVFEQDGEIRGTSGVTVTVGASGATTNLAGTVQLGGTTLTATGAELNHTDGVTSNIQTQLNAKLASSSYTASDVLTKIKTVDGSGSGLDADTLDGIQASAFVQSLSDLSITSTAAELNILDVSTQSPTDGQALTYSTANGLEWGSVASDSPFVENDQTITTSYTVASGKNAQGIGPITISNGAIITVSTGSKLVIT
jgi:hypothetical protein